MNKFFLLLVLIISNGIALRAQGFDPVRGKTVHVLDEVTLKPIALVDVRSWQPANLFLHVKYLTMTTDDKGKFLLNDWWVDSDQFTFTHSRYHPQEFTLAQLRGQGYIVFMRREAFDPQIAFSPTRVGRGLAQSPRDVSVIPENSHLLENAPDVSELLRETGAAYIQKDFQGAGSPIIGGFESNKVLVTLNGVRLNQTTLSGDHGNILARVDVNHLRSAEVLPGSASMPYGSDAVGGMVSLYEDMAGAGSEKGKMIHFTGFSRFSTASKEKTVHAELGLRHNRLASETSISFSGHDDLRVGASRVKPYVTLGNRDSYQEAVGLAADQVIVNDKPEIQVGSAYKRMNFHQSMSHQKGNFYQVLIFNLFDAPNSQRYDRLTAKSNLLDSTFLYGTSTLSQRWAMVNYYFSLSKPTKFYDHASLNLSWQRSSDIAVERAFNDDATIQNQEKVTTLGATLMFRRYLQSGSRLFYGFDFSRDAVTSTATHSLDANLYPKYPDGGSKWLSAAWFLQHEIKLKWEWYPFYGIRLNRTSLTASFTDRSYYTFLPENFSLPSNQLAWQVGIRKPIGSGINFRLFNSSGFRAPNANDLRVAIPGNTRDVIIPNENLRSEFSVSSQASLYGRISDIIDFNFTGFVNQIFNGTQVNTTESGIVFVPGDTLRAFEVTNTIRGRVIGFSTSLSVAISRNFLFYGRTTMNSGINTITKLPLDHIAPAFGRVGLQYSRKRFAADLYSWFNAAKRTAKYGSSPSENQNQATIDGTPAYVTFNLKLQYAIDNHFMIQGGIENFTDRQVRSYASSISEAGRNIYLTVRVNF